MTSTTSEPTDALRGRDVLQMPVYTIADGRSLGIIDTLYVRRDNLTVPLVRTKTSTIAGHFFIPYAAFQTVGTDVALVPNSGAAHVEMTPDEKNLDTGLAGRSVLTQGGEHVGNLTGFVIDTASGAIDSFFVRTDAGFFRNVLAAVQDKAVQVPAALIASLGPDAVILGPDAVALFRPNGAETAKQ